LLALLPEADFQRLSGHFERVSLTNRQVLFEPDQPIHYVHFPHNGTVVSLVTPMQDGSGVEAASVGSEGFVGMDVYLNGGRVHYRAVCQVPGEAVRIEAAAFRREAARSEALRAVLHRYILAMIVQLTQASACNRRHSVERRCARWLLTMRDRARSDTFPLTHEMLAEMLGVRRAGVTVVARGLQHAGLIRYARGTVTVLDRPRLEAASCECYGVIRREVERLLETGHARNKP
jgi:CRP-like cAMP-binding protein